MFRLQVTAPGYFVFKFVIVLFQDLNRLCIRHMAEIRIHHMGQALDQTFIHKGVKEIHLFRCILQHIAEDIFEHRLCQHHVILQIRERNFRLDHPEFRRMAGSVGIFCPERRSKRINIAECLGIRLSIQLAAHRQIGGFSEKVPGKVNFLFVIQGNVFQIQRGHSEHFSGSFTIASGDQRRMHIHKSSLLEELMDSVSRQGTHAEYRLKRIRPGTQMRNGP